MSQLTQPYTFDPHNRIDEIVIAGLGGTGSQLARSVARLIFDRKRRNLHVPRLVFIDPDIVQEHNVGRQMFTSQDAQARAHKAAVLGQRFNFALGLDIHWMTEPLNSERHLKHGCLVLGCVDNHIARAEIARKEDCLWIDCGNGYDHGQVVIGNAGDRQRVLDSLKSANRVCRYLPHAGLLFPALLEPDPEEAQPLTAPDASCAELVVRGDQSLLVNDLMAIVAAQYVAKLLNREPIQTFISFVSTAQIAVRSQVISPEAILSYLEDQ